MTFFAHLNEKSRNIFAEVEEVKKYIRGVVKYHFARVLGLLQVEKKHIWTGALIQLGSSLKMTRVDV